MALAEGVQGLITYVPYVSGAITANVEDNAPPTAGGKLLRRVSSTLNLQKNTYASNEIRSDRQIFDFRHGTRRAQGDIAGELSPATYFDFFEAVHRDTRAAGAALGPSDLTSVAASASGSSITFGGSDPVAKGLMVGDLVRFTGMTTAGNNNKNFMITGFGGTTNETVTVSPAPLDSAASTAFTVTRPGHSTLVPSTGQVSRKFGIEIYNEDVQVSRLFTECRMSHYQLSLPATGLSTCSFSTLGRDMVETTGPSYFTNPAPNTTTGITAAVNGTLIAGGTQVGVVTGVDLTHDLAPQAADVVGQNFPAEIFLGRANVTGRLTAYLQDTSLIGDFLNETELQLLVRLDATNAPNTPSLAFFLPRIKLSSADLALQGEAGQVITANFQALLYGGTAPGVPNTTIRIVDTEV